MESAPSEWCGYLLADFDFAGFPSGAQVLDIGCGTGTQLSALIATGCRAIGTDADRNTLRSAQTQGLAVTCGRAEDLPVRSASLDGILCKVCVPYCDEARALAEVSRVLKPGGRGLLSYHGAGYFLRYLLHHRSPSWKFRIYGFRTLLSTWFYNVSGQRLPQPFGDTLYQSRTRLHSYYERFGLRLVKDTPAPHYLGKPVFMYHQVERLA